MTPGANSKKVGGVKAAPSHPLPAARRACREKPPVAVTR